MTPSTTVRDGTAASAEKIQSCEEEIIPLDSAGYISAWLVAGPQEIAVRDLDCFDREQPRPQILERYHRPEVLVVGEPAEGQFLEINDLHGEARLEWRIERCGEDRLLDYTTFGFTCHYLRTWAFTNLRNSLGGCRCAFVLTANGPADVWINGVHVYSRVSFHFQVPGSELFFADLNSGDNLIVVAYSVVAIRECPYTFALQIRSYEGDLPLESLHTRLQSFHPLEDRRSIRSVLDAAAIDRSVYSGSDRLILRWPHGSPTTVEFEVRLVSIRNGKPLNAAQSLAHRTTCLDTSFRLDLGEAKEFASGDYTIVLSPFPNDDCRLTRHIPLTIANGTFASEPSGTYAGRAFESLVHAAGASDFYGEIAKIALGRWEKLRGEAWDGALRRIDQRGDCSDFYLVGMLGALHRYGKDPAFPIDLKERITLCALGFRYWRDEPGCDAMCFHTENHQILFHTCEVLAGQLFPKKRFANAGQTGEWHREKGERLAIDWLEKRAAGGFQEWDSNVYFEIDVAALTHLADLSQNPKLATLAMMVLDKLLLTIALNSYKGVFGSTHGRVYAHHIKGGRQELTSGICRILWGTGAFNGNSLGIVSLACASKYHLPPAIEEIALGESGSMWNRERHAGTFQPETDAAEGEWEVNKVSYKTPHFMLCSAQDLSPGNRGNQQHIWQATFGPDAVAFSTHPVCISENSARRPNFWSGNGILPRVAQWRDFLIALYELPADDWMGFTHAYFPVVHFDDWSLKDKWMFARKEEGYIALGASNGLDLRPTGSGVLDELRSPGVRCVWICQMGAAESDGSFKTFQDKVLSLVPSVDGTSIRTRTIRGEEVSFSWKGAFRVDGKEQQITGFKHYENPHCTAEIGEDTMFVRSLSHALSLNFRTRQRRIL